MPNRFCVWNTALNMIVVFEEGATFDNPQDAKTRASLWNRAMKPEHQCYTVVTLVFDAEV